MTSAQIPPAIARNLLSFDLKRVSSRTSRQLSGSTSSAAGSALRASMPAKTASSPAPSMRLTGANASSPATSTSPETTISESGFPPEKSSASRSESITSRRRSPSDVMARTADGTSSSRTKSDMQSAPFRRTSFLAPCSLGDAASCRVTEKPSPSLTRLEAASPSCPHSARSSPSASASTRVTFSFAASSASAMSSAALSGSAAASTTRPFSVSLTVSQDTVSGSSGKGDSAARTGVATATGSSPSATRTILTTRRDKGSASTASPGSIPPDSARNSPPV